ncbi:hypothetical protein AVEN_39003-1 [Araneus ventricosus]|uniref:Uncharacterized protein n=1 Tax=Araneus ventricosus TaxID=182803 RepID=A0A4Y2DN53_ARAVE|nr:hypothetical protein AVEN_39003-1 [Araneus ventricosus]
MLITTAPVLGYYDPNKEVRIQVDASDADLTKNVTPQEKAQCVGWFIDIKSDRQVNFECIKKFLDYRCSQAQDITHHKTHQENAAYENEPADHKAIWFLRKSALFPPELPRWDPPGSVQKSASKRP